MPSSEAGARRAMRRVTGWIALVIALVLYAAPAAAQEAGTVSGRVLSPAGEPVAGATVTATPSGGGNTRRATSGEDGAFRLTGVRPGRWTLRAARVGFTSVAENVTVAAGGEARVELRLAEQALVLDAVEVRSRRDTQRERTRFETEAGTTTRVITGDEIKILPGLGEADVLRAVEVLPGVVSTSDFSSAFNVRGGSSDQNLIQLDGFTIFNPFHLGGLFSVFNSDVIARAELLSGGFGAEYGGRVSSVLTIESETGDSAFAADLGVSVLASRLTLRNAMPGPLARSLGGSRGSWFVSGRRSYFDALLRPVTDFPYHLTDLQAGASVNTAGGGSLQFTGYLGEDVLDLSDFNPPDDDDEDDEPESILRVRWNWGNDVAGVRWTQPVGGIIAQTRVGFSRYAENVRFPDFEDTRFGSSITETALRMDLTREASPVLTLQAGGELVRMRAQNDAESGGTVFFTRDDRGWFGAGYGQVRWQPGPWIVEPGLRADVARSNAGLCGNGAQAPAPTNPVTIPARPNRTCVLLSPRVAVKRFLGAERDAAVKVAAGRYVQFLHSLRDENLPISNDTWILANESVPPVVSDQVQLGVEKYWGDAWYASAEAYYRNYRGVTDLNTADNPNDPGDDLLVGEGDSYGLDLLVRRNTGRLTGWTTVSLLRAGRTFPDVMAAGIEGVPQSVTFSPIFDRRVDVDVVLQYRLPMALEVGGRWNFGSGTPFTRPVAQVVGFETDVAQGGYRIPRPEGDDPEVPLYVVLGDRNRERYPAYHRLDLTVRRPYQRSWGTFTPYLQVLNVYNQRNVLFYFYNYERTPPTRSGTSMFPLLPSIGIEASF